MREQQTTLQYKFSFDNDSRTNHRLSLINTSTESQLVTSLAFACNANISQAWAPLGNQWACVNHQQNPNNTYTYSAPTLSSPILLPPGETVILEYSVTTALGPITNVAMPQLAVTANGIALDNVYTQNPSPNPNPDLELNEYHANWGQYQYQRTMKNEAWNKINALTYAFIGFDINGNVFALDTWGDQYELPLLNINKKNKPYLNSSISFGGWTNAGKRMDTVFSAMASNPASRQQFAQNAVSAALQVGVNGIDIDWESPKPEDAANFVLLLQELRAEMQRRGIQHPRLTIAAPASQSNISVFSQAQWKIIESTVDRISIMAYDYFGGFSQYADFHSAMNLSKDSPNYNTGFCVTDTIGCYKNLGIDAKKLSLGIPNYSRAVIVNELGNFGGLYQPVLGTPPGDFNDGSGIYGWDTICRFLDNPHDTTNPLNKLGVTEWHHYDSTHPFCVDAQMALLSGKLPNGQWIVINFLDQRCATLRGQYIKQQNLGGGMVWANYTEPTDLTKTITAAISDGFASLANVFQRAAATLSQLFSQLITPLKSIQPTRTVNATHFEANPSAPPSSNAPPSYEETVHVTYNRHTNPEISTIPVVQNPLTSEMVAQQASINTMRKACFDHALDLEDATLGKEKGKLMETLLRFPNEPVAMQNFIAANKKTLFEHRNIFKRTAVSLFGESANRLFKPPKSAQLTQELQRQCAGIKQLSPTRSHD